MSNINSKACLSCEKTENETPLVPMFYAGKEAYICPACLPVLIHKTEMLDGKFTALSNA